MAVSQLLKYRRVLSSHIDDGARLSPSQALLTARALPPQQVIPIRAVWHSVENRPAFTLRVCRLPHGYSANEFYQAVVRVTNVTMGVLYLVTSTHLLPPGLPSALHRSSPLPLCRQCRRRTGQGFRPCLRCLSESSPSSAAWSGTSAVVVLGCSLDRGGPRWTTAAWKPWPNAWSGTAISSAFYQTSGRPVT